MVGGAGVMGGEGAVTDLAEEEAVTDLAGEVEDTLLSVVVVMDSVEVTHLAEEVGDTLLSVVVVTDSVVITHLADSPAAALVRDSAGRGDFLLVDFLVAEITATLVSVVSVDAIATFGTVAFAILTGTLSISASMGSDIRITTRTTTL